MMNNRISKNELTKLAVGTELSYLLEDQEILRELVTNVYNFYNIQDRITNQLLYKCHDKIEEFYELLIKPMPLLAIPQKVREVIMDKVYEIEQEEKERFVRIPLNSNNNLFQRKRITASVKYH